MGHLPPATSLEHLLDLEPAELNLVGAEDLCGLGHRDQAIGRNVMAGLDATRIPELEHDTVVSEELPALEAHQDATHYAVGSTLTVVPVPALALIGRGSAAFLTRSSGPP